MDDYTRRTRDWLEAIYAGPPEGFGAYAPHSPVHGFAPLGRFLGTYAHTFSVLRHLADYEFRTCLDVGAGEGFLSALIERVFSARAIALDLAWQAARRARTVGLAAVCGEAVRLPFADASFDAVVSVNTLEHVPELALAYAELCRVARAVVIVGLPHARRGVTSEPPTSPHAHVSVLPRRAMARLFGAQARLCGSLSVLCRPLYPLLAADDVRLYERYAWLAHPPWRWVYEALRAAGGLIERRRGVAWLCRTEWWLSHLCPWWTYETVVVCTFPEARRRQPPLPTRRILAELLAERPLVREAGPTLPRMPGERLNG
jgi:SAM-dependent methyltransferase